jgi:hypothetical protein
VDPVPDPWQKEINYEQKQKKMCAAEEQVNKGKDEEQGK